MAELIKIITSKPAWIPKLTTNVLLLNESKN